MTKQEARLLRFYIKYPGWSGYGRDAARILLRLEAYDLIEIDRKTKQARLKTFVIDEQVIFRTSTYLVSSDKDLLVHIGKDGKIKYHAGLDVKYIYVAPQELQPNDYNLSTGFLSSLPDKFQQEAKDMLKGWGVNRIIYYHDLSNRYESIVTPELEGLLTQHSISPIPFTDIQEIKFN